MEKKKHKLTNSEAIKIISKSIQELRQDVDSLMRKNEEKEMSKKLSEVVSNSQFILDALVNFFPLPDTEKQKKDFFRELQDLMVKYKVYFVSARLQKRF